MHHHCTSILVEFKAVSDVYILLYFGRKIVWLSCFRERLGDDVGRAAWLPRQTPGGPRVERAGQVHGGTGAHLRNPEGQFLRPQAQFTQDAEHLATHARNYGTHSSK